MRTLPAAGHVRDEQPRLAAHRHLLHQAFDGVVIDGDALGLPKGLIIFSSPLSANVFDELRRTPDVIVWDERNLQQMLTAHPSVANEFASLLDYSKLIAVPTVPPSPESVLNAALQSRLVNLPTGNLNWREYENVCVDILNFLFVPPLGSPDIQSRSEDGLDRRDAIYPIRRGNEFWTLLRSEYRSRMLVVEFKNYSDPIRQTEVESIQQYLYEKAFRMFGILCCRKAPSESAVLARRRAWTEQGKMIVILSDSDLLEMLQMKADDDAPEDIIDLQLETFLTGLAP